MSVQRGSTALTHVESTRLDEVVRLARSKEQGVPGLMALLADASWSVRREVVASLAALGEIALAALCRSLEHDRANETRIAATVDALVGSASDVEGPLSLLISSPDPAVAADVAQILGRRRNVRSVPTLIALLTHVDDNVAVAATEALGRVGGRAAVDALVAAVERDYFFRTYPAIDVLGRSGDPRAVPPLARLLQSSQYVLEAARALGRTADKNAVAPLSELLASPIDGNVRVAAVALAELFEASCERYGTALPAMSALSHSAPVAAVRRVSQALMGADNAERVAMCVVLGALKREEAGAALGRMLEGVPPVASAAAVALKQLGRGVEEQLHAALRGADSEHRKILLPVVAGSANVLEIAACLDDPDATVRAMACDALARRGDSSVVALLFEQLTDPNPRVVQAAMSAIQSLGSAQTERLAIAATRSESSEARRSALRILSYFGHARAMDAFARAVHDGDVRVRDVAIAGLAFLEHPGARAMLLSVATDPSERSRMAAMRGLGQCSELGDAETAQVEAALVRGLRDPDAWVRYYAAQSLGKLGALDAAAAIIPLLSDIAGHVRVSAVESLAHLKSDAAVEALRKSAESSEPDVQRAALIGLAMTKSSEALAALVVACRSADPATRLVALSALASFPSAEAREVVSGALHDQDDGVRISAIGVLASWQEPEATKLLLDALRDERVRAQAMAALGTPAKGRIAGLLDALASADDELAPALVSLLGRLDPSDETGALLDALRLSNVPARKAAASMLAGRGTRHALAALASRAAEDPSDEVRRICILLLAQ